MKKVKPTKGLATTNLNPEEMEEYKCIKCREILGPEEVSFGLKMKDFLVERGDYQKKVEEILNIVQEQIDEEDELAGDAKMEGVDKPFSDEELENPHFCL